MYLVGPEDEKFLQDAEKHYYLQYLESYLGYLVLDPFLYAIESAVAMEHAAGGEERLGAQLMWVFIRGLKKKDKHFI